MIAFSNCKINLGLYVTNKRQDGYHDLSTCFLPIAITDIVEIIKSDTFAFTSTGIPIYSTIDNNLIVKAYRLLQKDFPQIGNVKMHLHKNIPTGAGVGGGSANASFALITLDKLFQLQLSKVQLVHYTAILGSDCPFFIYNQPCLATGRGELLQPIDVILNGYYLLIVFPKVHVSTKDAFANIVPNKPEHDIAMLMHSPITEWKKLVQNDFEKPVFEKYGELALIKNKMYQNDAIYASMSGSGSSIYGIYKSEETAILAASNSFANQYYKIVAL